MQLLPASAPCRSRPPAGGSGLGRGRFDFIPIQAPAKHRKPKPGCAYERSACDRGARPVRLRGIQASGARAWRPGDPVRQPGAEGIAVIGPSRDQAGQRRAGPGFDPGPGLGAVKARAARHAQGQGRPCRSVRPWIWARKPSRLRPRAGSVPGFGGAPAALACARTTVPFRHRGHRPGDRLRGRITAGLQDVPSVSILPWMLGSGLDSKRRTA